MDMTALTIILILAAVVSFATAITCGAFAIRGLVEIAYRRAPERFPTGRTQFSIWQLHDLSTYIAAFRLLFSTWPSVVPDSSCRRCLVAFQLSSVLGIVAIILSILI
jgi:hypothetical protein